MEDNLYAPPKANLEDIVPSGAIRLYSPRQIAFAAFFGGPLAGAWFMSRNFRMLSLEPDSKKTLMIGVALLVCLLPIIYVMPEKTPNVVIPLAYSLAFRYFANRRFAANAAEGVGFARGWRSWAALVGISCVCAIVAVLFYFAAFLLIGLIFPHALRLELPTHVGH